MNESSPAFSAIEIKASKYIEFFLWILYPNKESDKSFFSLPDVVLTSLKP